MDVDASTGDEDEKDGKLEADDKKDEVKNNDVDSGKLENSKTEKNNDVKENNDKNEANDKEPESKNSTSVTDGPPSSKVDNLATSNAAPTEVKE